MVTELLFTETVIICSEKVEMWFYCTGGAYVDFDLMIKQLMHKYSIDINRPWFYESVQAEELIKCFWKKVKYKKIVLLFEKQGDYENFRIHIPKGVSYTGIQYQNSSFFSYSNFELSIY